MFGGLCLAGSTRALPKNVDNRESMYRIIVTPRPFLSSGGSDFNTRPACVIHVRAQVALRQRWHPVLSLAPLALTREVLYDSRRPGAAWSGSSQHTAGNPGYGAVYCDMCFEVQFAVVEKSFEYPRPFFLQTCRA